MADYRNRPRDEEEEHEACGINGRYCGNDCPKLNP